MKTKMKPILALCLALVMMLSAVPMFAFAADLPTIPFVEVSGGDGSVTVKRGTVTYPADKDVYYYNILYSTDQRTWLLAGSMPRDSALRTVTQPEEGAFVPGTTYYFAVQPVSWNNETGQLSPSASITFKDSEGEKRAEWEAVMAGYQTKTTEKGAKYDKVKLVKGEKLIWDNGLYTLTVQVTAVSAAKAKLKLSMKNKTGAIFECHYIGWNGNPGGMLCDLHEGSKNVTVNLTKFYDGANYLQFSVTGYGNPVAKYSSVARGNEYNEYADKLIYLGRKHTLYFQKAPAVGAIDASLVAATKNTVTLGTAYKTTNKAAKGSGTIVYYCVNGAKKWSKQAFAGGKAMTIKKLKANTLYQFKIVNYVKALSAADNKTVVTSMSGESKVQRVRTALAAAPEIASIRVSGAKVGKIHVNGYWESDGDWHPAYDVTVTSYKVTVTLKSAPKGMQGIMVTGADRNGYPNWIKGTGKTFTFTANAKGNAIGKSVKLGVCSFTNAFGRDYGHSGYSPAVKKTVTIR